MFSRQARTAWLRTRGMLALLLLLIVPAFVVPAVVAPGAAWRFATDVILTFVVAIGVVAITDHRTPVSRMVRSLSILEALVDQLYPAVIIARLVSLEFVSDPESNPRQANH
jgi:hypothetical protein